MFKLAMWTVEIRNKLIDWWHKLIMKLTYRYYKDFNLKCTKCGYLLKITLSEIYYDENNKMQIIIFTCWCGHNKIYSESGEIEHIILKYE